MNEPETDILTLEMIRALRKKLDEQPPRFIHLLNGVVIELVDDEEPSSLDDK